MEEISIALKDLLLNLNLKDLIHHIDICLNTFLYTILEKNIQKEIFLKIEKKFDFILIKIVWISFKAIYMKIKV